MLQESKRGNPSKQTLPVDIYHLKADCIRLTLDAKNIGDDLQLLQKNPPSDTENTFEKLAGRLLDLAKKIHELAGKLDDIGMELLSGGMELSDKESLTPKLNEKLKVQGKHIQDCGKSFGNIGKSFTNACEKVESIGNRVTNDNPEIGISLKNLENELKRLSDLIMKKGESCQNTGGALQQLQPSENRIPEGDNGKKNSTENILPRIRENRTREDDNRKKNDTEDIHPGIPGIGKYLEDILQVLIY